MPKFLARFLALALVPCLLANSALSAVLQKPLSPTWERAGRRGDKGGEGVLFADQALALVPGEMRIGQSSTHVSVKLAQNTTAKVKQAMADVPYSYRPDSRICDRIVQAMPRLKKTVAGLFGSAQTISTDLTSVAYSSDKHFSAAIDIVSRGPNFNKLKDYGGDQGNTGRTFWTVIRPWDGWTTHNPILQFSFEGRFIDMKIYYEIKRHIEEFLRLDPFIKSMDGILVRYLFDALALMFQVDAIREHFDGSPPADLLPIKNPVAIKDILMVDGGADAPKNWRKRAAGARGYATRLRNTTPAIPKMPFGERRAA